MTGRHLVTLLPGDGIGPEVTGAACQVIEASGAHVSWEAFEVGMPAVRRGGDPLPNAVVESVRRNGVALKGPVTTLPAGLRSVNVALRRTLDLYCQARRCRSVPGVPSRYSGVDLVVLRETTEDLYAGVEVESGDGAERVIASLGARGATVPTGAGLSIKYTSEAAARRMVHFALAWARRNGRKRITVVHKATVMRATDGLFLAAAREIAQEEGDVELDDCLVDSLAAQLVRCPERFDVLVTSNLYGDILSDLGAGLVGSVGLVPGANFGDGVALFEPGHGSAPRHAGHDRANPIGTILSGAMMLRHLGELEAARRVEDGIARVVSEGRAVTYDIAGPHRQVVGTAAFADAVCVAMG